MLHIDFPSKKTTRSLFIILGVLVVLHLIVMLCHTVFHIKVEALTALVDLDLESNIPTFFNGSLFFLAAVLFYLHGKGATGKTRAGWYLMAGVFIFLGFDEGSQIHEKFMLFTIRLIAGGGQDNMSLGWLYYAWVIPYGLAALALVALLAPWLLRLEPKLRKGLIISGSIYVFGAVFLEMAGGKVATISDFRPPSDFPWMPCSLYGDPIGCWLFLNPIYITLYTLEEIFEMSGLILCIHFLLKAFERKGLLLSLNAKPQA